MEILIASDSRVKSAAVAQRMRLLSINRLASSIVLTDLGRWCTTTNLSPPHILRMTALGGVCQKAPSCGKFALSERLNRAADAHFGMGV
jgi:hypothetical protein